MNNNNKQEERRRTVEDERPQLMSVPMMPARAALTPALQATTTPVKSSPLMVASVKPKQNQNQKQEQLQGSSQQRWMVENAPTVPSYYQLTRTHTVVPETSKVVSERIENHLYESSIAATFQSDEALCKGETAQSVKFAVRLWQAADEGVTVEVQRCCGCSFGFQQVAKAILCAAAGQPLPKARELHIPKSLPPIDTVTWEKNSCQGLELASNLLELGSDAQLLALESILQLTQSPQCRVYCAKCILDPECAIRSVVLQHVESLDSPLHRHAVAILANCLEEHRIELPQSLLEALLMDVRDAASRPHEAATACRCLRLLVSKDQVVTLGLGSYVAAAQHFRHAGLQRECTKLLESL